MTVTFTIIRRHTMSHSPWKNGGGSTTQIAIHPPGATVSEPFHWRLSLATVASSGPFSAFPGYDRGIVQLSGPPMELDHDGAAPLTLPLDTPHLFSGDSITVARLSHPTEDFNCMVRRDLFAAQLTCCSLDSSPSMTVELNRADELIWLFVISGEAQIITQVPTALTITLSSGDAVCLQGLVADHVEIIGHAARLIVTRIFGR